MLRNLLTAKLRAPASSASRSFARAHLLGQLFTLVADSQRAPLRRGLSRGLALWREHAVPLVRLSLGGLEAHDGGVWCVLVPAHPRAPHGAGSPAAATPIDEGAWGGVVSAGATAGLYELRVARAR